MAATPTTQTQPGLSQDAALTILLHASKYPSSTVCGVLLGPPDQQTATAALPLFHASLLLSPPVETALAQAEAHAAASGQRLLGYYHAEARFDAADVHPCGKRVASAIAERCADAFAVALDGRRLAAFAREGSDEPPLLLLQREGSGPKAGWRVTAQAPRLAAAETAGAAAAAAAGDSSGGWAALRARYLNLHAAGRHAELADFDEHLDDVARDWLNAALKLDAPLVR